MLKLEQLILFFFSLHNCESVINVSIWVLSFAGEKCTGRLARYWESDYVKTLH